MAGAILKLGANPFGRWTNNKRGEVIPPNPGGSLLFTGENNCRSVFTANNDWAFGTGDFTVETFFYQEVGGGSSSRLWSIGEWPTCKVGVSLENSTGYLWVDGNNIAFDLPIKYAWHHCVVQRKDGVVHMWLDGELILTVTEQTHNLGIDTLTLGNEGSNGQPNSAFKGNITNFAITKAARFAINAQITVPSNPLPVLPTFKLLLRAMDADNALVDNSPEDNYSITNNYVTWSDRSPFVSVPR